MADGDEVLRRLEVALTDLPRTVMQRAAQEIRDWTAQQVAAQFSTGRDLYGNPWPTPKDGGRPMVRSGDLRSGYTFRLEQTGTGYRILIGNRAPYAKYLQSGTATMKPRTHMPRALLPQAWRDGYARIIRRWMERTLRP